MDWINAVKKYSTAWNVVLLVSVVFAAFFLPLLPVPLQKGLFRISYSIIYTSAYFSLTKRSKYLLSLFLLTLIIEWISSLSDLPVLSIFTRGINIIFFMVIVVSLIYQIAISREVTPGTILGSIAGYILLGLIYSIFIAFILQNDAGAYNYQLATEEHLDASIPTYYGYVTLATVGYGDIVPLKPYTRSLATWIAISGQFYIAIIVALLVGKFAARRE
jgi:voltage-gated potassium channel